MAIFKPSIEDIRDNIKPIPEPGEMELLQELEKNLDDSYEVYFQPFLNGKIPDIIIMRKNMGVLIIEVKDYSLDLYEVLVEKDLLKIKNNETYIRTPMKQVENYKDILYNLYSVELGNAKILNRNSYGIIKTAVYFSRETKETVNSKFDGHYKHTILWGYNSKVVNEIKNFLTKERNLFTENIYNDLVRIFNPSINRTEQNNIPILNKKQEQLSQSYAGKSVKIKGVAGSGKTLVLAKRAINAFERTNDRVLILTFNITLTNYLKDKISQFRHKYQKSNFYITNFHNFIKNEFEEHCEHKKNLDSMKEYINFRIEELKTIAEKEKYSAIFIDEVQDFEYEWLKFIKDEYLENDGEYVLFGDEKQNIYNKELEDREIKTNIRGGWNKLKDSYRMGKEIVELAMKFQNKFMDELEIDEYNIVRQIEMFEEPEDIEYIEVSNNNTDKLWDIINSYIKQKDIAPNDVTILSPSIKSLRELEKYAMKTKIEFTTTFETEEQHKKIESKEELDKLRKRKKFNFWMNTGKIKMSTIHSFKGWETHTLFLVLNDDKNDEEKTEISNNELIYTAITRCRNNLIIIQNTNSEKMKAYCEFFKTNVK